MGAHVGVPGGGGFRILVAVAGHLRRGRPHRQGTGMKKTLRSIAVLSLAMPFAAQAADVPAAAPAYQAPVLAPPAAYNWTGFYLGGSLGGEWERIDGNFVNPPPGSWSVDNSRGLWDAHVGAQYQWGSVVLGVEGNFVGLFNNSNGGTSGCGPSCGAAFMSANLVDNIWTIGGRLGRSEEDTSELQPHSFIPYPVSCLKK